MCAVDVPVDVVVSLVAIKTVLNAQRNFVHGVGKAKIDGRIVDRIGAHDEQHVDLAGIHVGDQVLQSRGLIGWLDLDGFGVDDSVAGCAQRCVHRVRKSMNRGRLIVARNDDCRSLVCLQILHHRRNKLLIFRIEVAGGCATRAESRCDRTRKRFDFRGTHRQAMVGLTAGVGRRALNRVEADHLLFELGIAPRRKLTRVINEPGITAGEEIAVERENDLGLLQVVTGFDVIAERHHRTGAHVVAIHRLPLESTWTRDMPLAPGPSKWTWLASWWDS